MDKKNPAADRNVDNQYRFRKATPMPIKRLYRWGRNAYLNLTSAIYDLGRFSKYSGTFDKERDVSTQKAEITKYYHTIEKGLALPEPRPGFGRQMNHDLCLKIQKALKQGILGHEIQYAVDSLDGYKAFNLAHGVDNPAWIDETLALAASKGMVPQALPTRQPKVPGILSPQDRLDFITSRHSVRHFSDAVVPDAVLTAATRAAQSAPCVCNRQASKVYFVKDPETKRKMLACQNGNRGFGDRTPVVALVTVDLRSFLDASERYQAWIDGGLFAMNLLLGIHAQDYGACCLNWSALPAQDKALRKLGMIPAHETVITMIAIGALRDDNFVVARSERHPIEDVMRII